jgi:V/A-type H+-transporting ATPase subunit E
MGKQDIIDAIIADAEKEAEQIIAEAKGVADRILAEAQENADKQMSETISAAEDKAGRIIAGREASARLDGAKIKLADKRAVIDGIYAKAFNQLSNMKSSDCLAMTERLLISYAEEGDEIIFADAYPCAKQVSTLKVVADKKLKITFNGRNVEGGFILCGKNSDKDLSFAALLAADREEHEAEIASELFKA